MTKQNHYLWRIASMSKLAAARLDDETFRIPVIQDEDTPDNIIDAVQTALLQDMLEIGLYLTCPTSDLVSGDMTQEWFADVLEWILPSPLYGAMRHDSNVRQAIGVLTCGSITNGNILTEWLTWLKDLRPELSDAIDYYLPRFTTSDVFNTYFDSILETYNAEKNVANLADGFLISRVAEMFHTAEDLFSTITTKLEDNEVTQQSVAWAHTKLRAFERECLNVEFANRLGWYLRSGDSLPVPSAQVEFRDKVLKEVLCVCPMSAEYYTWRKQPAIGTHYGTVISDAIVRQLLRLPVRNDDTFREIHDFEVIVRGTLHHE